MKNIAIYDMLSSLQLPGGKLETLKEQLYKQTVDILLAYRDKVANTAASGQLILPESMKLLPLYTLGLVKNCAFRCGTKLYRNT